MYSSFLVFIEMTGISLNHFLDHIRTIRLHKNVPFVAPTPGEICTVTDFFENTRKACKSLACGFFRVKINKKVTILNACL